MANDTKNQIIRRRSELTFIYQIIVSLFIFTTIILFISGWFINIEPNLININFIDKTPNEPNFILHNVIIKKDWHDRLAMVKDYFRTGLGEQGRAAKLPVQDADQEQEIFHVNGFNGLLSDRISLNRSLPDIRYKECHNKTYLSKLPSVSVIIPFYNEHWSTLLRSVYSILNRSPPELIQEIILIDDFSDKDFLGEKLDKFVDENLPKVKIVRLNERSGLIKARLAGAKIAKAEVLLFLDSHIEANYNWLPPLLEPIAMNSKTVMCPFIDVIDDKNFAYSAQDKGARGAFDWNFDYKRLNLLPEDLKDCTRPFRSPIMAGGLFAINRKWFWELGGYDPELDIWGGEQYELSFKIWMCGGEMFDAPCSRVGHIYRGDMETNSPRKTDYLRKNYKRVAEVWMDEYAQYIYNRYPNTYKSIDPGDLTVQKALRKRLNCKSFKWFIEEIAFDLPIAYPPLEQPVYAFGAIQSLANSEFCLDTMGKYAEIGLYTCADDLMHPQENQDWKLTMHKDLQLRNSPICIDTSERLIDTPIVLQSCHRQKGNQLWFYNQHKKWLMNGNGLRCLEANFNSHKVYVNDCNVSNVNMRWKFGYVNASALNSYHVNRP